MDWFKKRIKAFISIFKPRGGDSPPRWKIFRSRSKPNESAGVLAPDTLSASNDGAAAGPGHSENVGPDHITPQGGETDISGSRTGPSEGDSPKTVIWNTFRTALDIANEATDGIPLIGLKSAIGGLIAVIKTFEAEDANMKDIQALTQNVERMREDIIGPLKTTSTNGRLQVTESLKQLAETLEKQLDKITETARAWTDRPRFQRMASGNSDGGVIRQMNQDLDRALAAFQTGTIVSIAQRMEDVVNKAESNLIMSLPRAPGARHDSALRSSSGSVTCLEGTREGTLNEVKTWLSDASPSVSPIFWIWGLAGTGKSTIAQTIAEFAASQGCLGASFCFSRDQEQLRNALFLIPSIAFQLSIFHPSYKHHLAQALEQNPDAGHANLHDQVKTLLVGPLQQCGALPSPVVLVIDALDECEPETQAERIIQVLSIGVQSLTKTMQLRILLTSRPEHQLHSKFRSSGMQSLSTSYVLHNIEDNVVIDDIGRYIRHHLHDVAVRYEISEPWPNEEQMDVLMKKAGTLFIVAATLVKFIDDGFSNDPKEQLETLTEDGGDGAFGSEKSLIGMYATVLRRAIPPSGDPDTPLERFKTVVGTILLLKQPMSQAVLKGFLGLPPDSQKISGALSRLKSVLIVPDMAETPVRVLHQSFPEVLTAPQQRGQRFYIDPSVGNARLAALCLTHLAHLEKNMCKIDHRGTLNDEVNDLRERIDTYIPHHLQYSCLYFADHVTVCPPNDQSLVTLLTAFCESSILPWIETLSYLGRLEVAVHALKVLRQWSTLAMGPTGRTTEILRDAQRLVVRFFDVICQGGGHLYITALPWSPPCALRAQYEAGHAPTHIVRQAAMPWGMSVCTINLTDSASPEGHRIEMHAISPDGSLLLVVQTELYLTRTVRVWDTTTSANILTLEIDVIAAAFSPDNEMLCVLTTHSICTLDIITGITTRSFNFSEKIKADNGRFLEMDWKQTCIAYTHSIGYGSVPAVWDLATGELRFFQLDQERRISCVVLALDGTMIAAADTFGGVHAWDLTQTDDAPHHQFEFPSHDTRFGPFSIQTNQIRAIAICDQRRILSATSGYIDVWDLATGSHETRRVEHLTPYTQGPSSYPGGKLVTWSTDRKSLDIRDLQSGVSLISLSADELGSFTPQISFSSGSTLFATLQGDRVYIWDGVHHPGGTMSSPIAISDPEAASSSELPVNLDTLSKDGSLLAECYSHRTIRVIQLPSCTTIGETSIEEPDDQDGQNVTVLGMALSPDNTRLVTISRSRADDNEVRENTTEVLRIWALGMTPFRCLHALRWGYEGIAPRGQIDFSADSSLFAVASGDYSELMIIATHLGTITRRLLIKEDPEIEDFGPEERIARPETEMKVHDSPGIFRPRIQTGETDDSDIWGFQNEEADPLQALRLEDDYTFPLSRRSRRARRRRRTTFEAQAVFVQLPDSTPAVVATWHEEDTDSGYVSKRRYTCWSLLSGRLLASRDASHESAWERLLVLPSGMIALCGRLMQTMDPVTLKYIGEAIPGTASAQVGPDGNINFLEVRGEWLCEFDGSIERRLCYLPGNLRGETTVHWSCWQGPYLVLPESAILDIDYLRLHACPLPSRSAGERDQVAPMLQ